MEGRKINQISKELEQRETEFTDYTPLQIFCGTWNVNGKRPPESLSGWLSTSGTPDIFALGFQELDLTGGALLLGDTSRSAPWEEIILSTLNEMDNYSLVFSKQLVGMLLCIVVRDVHSPYVKDIKSNVAGCGLMGKMGNKGGVAIRFKLYDSTLCFVNSHLSAHAENAQRRNQDYKEICRRIVFTDDHGESFYTIFNHDILYWVGDLNYRVNMEDSEVRRKVQEKNFAELLQYDQLLIHRKNGAVFENFSEAQIDFAPTYKYDTGTDNYDTSEKSRTPSWCDRVLWCSPYVDKTLKYTRHELLSSDHRPVSGLYEVKFKTINIEKRKQVMQEIVKQLDKIENEKIPQCDISSPLIDFGNVYYMTPVVKSIRITNLSQNENDPMVNFFFVPKLNSEQQTCKPWLQIVPTCGVVSPGKDFEITFTVNIDDRAAPSLNLGDDQISDILIIRLEKGVDHYVEISGKYSPSSFGNYLNYLIRHPKPVYENDPLLPDSPKLLSIPKEMWRLVDYLHNHRQPDLFIQLGQPEEIKSIIRSLDSGIEFTNVSEYSVGAALLKFLDSLADPVIPFSMYQNCIECSSLNESKQLLSSLQFVNYNVFYYLMAFLRDLIHTVPRQDNQFYIKSLAAKFAGVLIRPPMVERIPNPNNRVKSEQFVLQFLELQNLMVP